MIDAYSKFGKLKVFVQWFDHLMHGLYMIGSIIISLFYFDINDTKFQWYLFRMHLSNKGTCIQRMNIFQIHTISRILLGVTVLVGIYLIIGNI